MAIPAVLVFALLGGIFPILLITDVARFKFDTSACILYGALIYASARLAHLAYTGERRLLTLTFWLFAYVWGLLSAILQVGTDLFPWERQPSNDEQLETAALLILALLAFELGSWIAQRRERRHPKPDAWVFSLRWTFVVGLAAIVLAVFMIAALGGLSVVMQPRGDAIAAFWREGGTTAARNLLEVLLRMAPFVASFAILFTLQNRWRELSLRGRWRMLGVFAVIAPVALITNYPDALSRGWLGTVGLSFGFLLTPWRRWTMGCVIVVLVCAFVFAFPYSDQNRAKSLQTRETLAPRAYRSPAVPLMIKGDYDIFVQFANTRAYAQETDYMYGGNLLAAALFWVPRSLWENKPLSSGSRVGVHFHTTTTNLSSPLWAEGYLAFGVLGVVMLMGGYGFVVGRLDFRYVQQIRLGIKWGILQLFVPFWAAYQIFFLRGPLMHTVAFSSFAVLLFLLLARWRSVSIQANSPQPPLPQPFRGPLPRGRTAP